MEKGPEMAEMSRASQLTGRELARARRRELSLKGAAALKGGQSSRPSRLRKRAAGARDVDAGNATAVDAGARSVVASTAPAADTTADTRAAKPVIGPDGKEYCCEECARLQLPEPCTPCTLSARIAGRELPAGADARQAAVVETVCEIVERDPQALGEAGNSVRALCRERRRKLARVGSKALPGGGASRPSRPPRRRGAPAVEGGLGASDAEMPATDKPAAEEGAVAAAAEEAVVETVCEIVEVAPGALGGAEPTVRAFCRERRRKLARMGKKALTKNASILLATESGRERARRWRQERCRRGRGEAPACRPTGRVRPKPAAPRKVEESATLAGQVITGQHVGRSVKVTGDEHGTCRVITGTEYLGAEQFAQFCGATPAPNAPKVEVSRTSHDEAITGTKVGHSVKVTGDEHGACKAITGTEYLGAEDFQRFCGSRGMVRTPEKVSAAPSSKGLRITGVDEARATRVTGMESGLERPITGTPYTVGAASAPAPEKVAVTHTSTGRAVTGTSPVSIASPKVTGDEHGACERITGTEYAPAEEVAGACGVAPEAAPPKVEVDATGKGLPITGNIPGRSPRVTGDEAGACTRITGTQYGDASRAGLCERGPEQTVKPRTHTARGTAVTGTEASPAPGMTGADVGACADVSGTEYVSAEAMRQTCGTTPAPAPQKVGVSTTWQGNPVSGVQVGPAPNMTGNEAGTCATITGDSYLGREDVGAACATDAVQANERQLRRPHMPAGKPMTGIQPGPDEQVTGVIERGVCQQVSGTPYVGADQYARACGVSQAMPAQQGDFSIMTPAREAIQRRGPRISGSPYYGEGKITGSASKGLGLITGTPEFRHPHLFDAQGQAPQEEQGETQAQAARITGEAMEPRRQRITGDDWSRNERVTGTEGMSAAVRNPTRRGDAAPRPGANARTWMREVERLEVPEAPITGSSGNTNEGAVVTVSGGARG